MKKYNAFTLIEILVSISIVTIITFSGSYYFFDFLENKEISNQTIKIKDKIEELDNQIRNQELFDYKIIFNENNSGSYIVYKNIFDTEYKQTIQGGKISINNYYGENWNKKIYEEHKLKLNETSTGNFITYYFKDTKNYKIIGNLESFILNEIELIRLDKINKNLNLYKISETQTGANIGNIEIINIGGVKSFSGTTQDSFFLHFENKGKEGYLEINKF